MEPQKNGVMECWSNGVLGFGIAHHSNTPVLQYSTTPVLHHSNLFIQSAEVLYGTTV